METKGLLFGSIGLERAGHVFLERILAMSFFRFDGESPPSHRS